MILLSLLLVLALAAALAQTVRLYVAQEEIDELLFELEGLTWARSADFDDEDELGI